MSPSAGSDLATLILCPTPQQRYGREVEEAGMSDIMLLREFDVAPAFKTALRQAAEAVVAVPFASTPPCQNLCDACPRHCRVFQCVVERLDGRR